MSSFCRVEREGESKKDTEAEGTACAKEEIRKGLENYAMYKLGVGVVTMIGEKTAQVVRGQITGALHVMLSLNFIPQLMESH